MRLYKSIILLLFFTKASASQKQKNPIERDIIREGIINKESFLQGELRQMAALSFICSPLVGIWGALHYAHKIPQKLIDPPHCINPCKKKGLRFMATASILTLPLIAMAYRIERKVDEEIMRRS
jgi:hypothetical protein